MKVLRIFSLALLIVLGIVAMIFAKQQDEVISKQPLVAEEFVKHDLE